MLMILSPSGAGAALVQLCLWRHRGGLWEGANPNLREKQRFTLKISLAWKAGAWGLPVFSSRSLPAGKKHVVFCTCLQPSQGSEGFSLLCCPAPPLDMHSVTISPLRGRICRSHSEKKAAASERASPASLREAGRGWQRGACGMRGLSLRHGETHFPVGTWVSTFRGSPSIVCLPGGWSWENTGSGWESCFLSLLVTLHLT